jgi:hypothetical protein
MANTWGKIIGGAIGVYLADKATIAENDKPLIVIGGMLLGGWMGGEISDSFSEPADTVNYTLYHKGRRVYEGICYHDRKSSRLFEHVCAGKKFTTWKFGAPITRSSALEIERKRIKKYQPFYNIHHNCD